MARPLVSKESNVSDATVRRHIRTITGLKSTLDAASGEYRAALKAAKGDGINTAQMIAAMGAKKREVEDVHAGLKTLVRYLNLFDMPTKQADLFDGAAANDDADGEDGEADADGEDSEHARWRAEEAGYAAGAGGELKEANPHRAGSFQATAWHAGWLRGQEQVARGAGNGIKKASTRRQRTRAAPHVN